MAGAEVGGRDVAKPVVDFAQLAAHMNAKWGIFYGHGGEVAGERDSNFIMAGPDHESVVKVCHTSTTGADVELRLAAMKALAGATGFVVPLPKTAIDGSHVSFIDLESGRHIVYAVSVVDGRGLADRAPITDSRLGVLGAAACEIPNHLAGVEGAPDDFLWDLRQAPETVRRHLDAVGDDRVRELLRATVDDCEAQLAPIIQGLPVTTIHGDLNDANVVFDEDDTLGIFDFGDIHISYRIAELAIAAAYATITLPNPTAGVVAMTYGAAGRHVFSEAEADAVVPLLRLRLALSVAIGSAQTAANPDNAYLGISLADAIASLQRWAAVPPRIAKAHVRHAAGLPAIPNAPKVVRWLRRNSGSFSSPIELPLMADSVAAIDWSVTSPHVVHPDAGGSVADATAMGEELMRRAGATVGLGCWGEPRLVYATADYDLPSNGAPRTRTVHTGVDLSCPPGTAVHAVHAGVVERIDDDAVEGGYGPVVTVRHQPHGPVFWTLYGHLARDDQPVSVGDSVIAGQRIGSVGEDHENGGWPPHLHFQVMTDTLDIDGPFPGVAAPDEWEVWAQICPSPAPVLGLDEDLVNASQPDDASVLEKRHRLLPPSLSTSYSTPLVAVRGLGAHLYDGWGRCFLDCVNNVAHVGHEHPHVVEALASQARVLNTNSRYPHPQRVRYMERLAELFADPLDTVFLVNSGSEANDLALRIATAVTGRRHMAVAEHGYHGHTDALIAASHHKHSGPGGTGTPNHVTVVPTPDLLREPDIDHVGAALEALEQGPELAAGLFEAVPSVAGQVVLPTGYVAAVFAAVRSRGGVAIADEVQTGLGRVGPAMWAYAAAGALPDIVTLGKPIGNGHPLGAVVTSRAIADAFANGMEYFNTFGGNPVSCAVGNAVLDVVFEEDLPAHAAEVGAAMLDGLTRLEATFPLIGDVRGAGLFVGVELTTDRNTLEPAPEQTGYIVDRARDLGVLLSSDGPHHNVLKIKPPLAFTATDVAQLIDTLGRILGEDAAQPG